MTDFLHPSYISTLGVEVRHVVPLLEDLHPVVVERSSPRVSSNVDDTTWRAGSRAARTRTLTSLSPSPRAVRPEVRDQERAVGAGERRLDARLVVEVRTDDSAPSAAAPGRGRLGTG